MSPCNWTDGIASYLDRDECRTRHFGKNILHPHVDGNRESYTEFQVSEKRFEGTDSLGFSAGAAPLYLLTLCDPME